MLHYAAHGHAAAEVIYERADAENPFMGLTSFFGELLALKKELSERGRIEDSTVCFRAYTSIASKR